MDKIWIRHKWIIVTLTGIIMSGIFLRIYNLTILPVFADEAIYIRWAQVMRAEASLRFLPLSDGKQPLYMWVVIPFLKIISDPLFAGRIVSVLTGLGSLLGIFVLTKILFNSLKLSLISSFLYMMSPFAVFFDRLALADSMLSFFGIWALIFFVITVKKVRLDTAMLSGFFLGGALLTKSPAVFFALLSPIALALAEWPKHLKDKFNKLTVFVFLFAFTYAISYGMYNILRLGPEFHMISLRNKDYVYPLSHIFQSPWDPFLPFFDRVLEYYRILGPFSLIALLLIGVFYGINKFRKETLLLTAWIIIPIAVSSEFSKTMTARYVFFTLPYIIVLGSLSFYWLEQKAKNILLKNISNFLLMFFVLQSLYTDFFLVTNPQRANLPRSERSGYLEDWTSGYGIKEVSLFLKEEYQKNPDNKIIVGTEGYFGTLPDGLQIYMNDLPEITVIGVGQPLHSVPRSLAESKASGNDTYLLVNSNRLLFNADENGLILMKEFPKAVKPDGTQDKLLFFKI